MPLSLLTDRCCASELLNFFILTTTTSSSVVLVPSMSSFSRVFSLILGFEFELLLTSGVGPRELLLGEGWLRRDAEELRPFLTPLLSECPLLCATASLMMSGACRVFLLTPGTGFFALDLLAGALLSPPACRRAQWCSCSW